MGDGLASPAGGEPRGAASPLAKPAHSWTFWATVRYATQTEGGRLSSVRRREEWRLSKPLGSRRRRRHVHRMARSLSSKGQVEQYERAPSAPSFVLEDPRGATRAR